MKKFSFSCLVALSLLSLSCKKMDGSGLYSSVGATVNPNTVYVHFYQGVLDYIQLPANRYFIYKDSASGSLDSVRVTQSVIETNFQAATVGYPATYSDVFKLTLTKFQMVPPTNQIWFSGLARCTSFGGIISATILDSNITFYNEQSNLFLFWYPFSSFGVNQYSYMPTMTVEGITYTGVQRFFSSNTLSPTDINYQASVTYWVKGIGIIKKESRTYNSVKTSLLVRYG